MREVVLSFRFLYARFSLEYMSTVKRKRWYCELVELLQSGANEPVMTVYAGVKTFFFKLHTRTLPVLIRLGDMTVYLPREKDCRPSKKPGNVEQVLFDCWDLVFFWGVLQRTLRKEMPLAQNGSHFFEVGHNDIPYDVFFFLGLHTILRSRMAVRNSDMNARPIVYYFAGNICKLREVYVAQERVDKCIETNRWCNYNESP